MSSILEQEIAEQPTVIRRLLETESEKVAAIAAGLKGRFSYITIAARGTSDNAARYAQYLLGSHNRLPIALAAPSLFTTYQTPPSMANSLVIGISQSGRSPDIVSVIEEGRRQGQPTLVFTNDPASPLAQAADHVIPLQTGSERAVAATKTYTASLLCLALLSCHLDPSQERFDQLNRLPELMEQTLEAFAPVAGRVERYRYMDHCVVISRGFNYATAFEISLKMKELTGAVAEPYSSADFLHGPIAMVRRGFPVMIVAPSGAALEDMQTLKQRLDHLQAELLVISDRDDLLERANLSMRLPAGVPEWLSPLIAVLPGQLFSLHLALARGMNPDEPEGLRKVTETW